MLLNRNVKVDVLNRHKQVCVCVIFSNFTYAFPVKNTFVIYLLIFNKLGCPILILVVPFFFLSL